MFPELFYPIATPRKGGQRGVEGVGAADTPRPQRKESGLLMIYDPYLGRVISEKYRIIDFIGQGGMGAVYLAEHETLPRRFAIKILKSEYLEHESFVERFRREAIAASRIVHPNIVYITDFGRLEEGNFYIVMEYLEGEGLDALLETHGKIPLTRALPILIQVADALDHAHSVGVVHRDLKAENVLLTREHGRNDVVKLLDFGIARLMLPSFSRTRITQHGQVFGTPEYMSPEQASDKTIDGRSDIYSLGVLAYELLTGMPPFYDEDPTEILQAHLSESPVAPSTKMPEQPIPKLFDGLVLKCLAKVPEDRFQSARKLKSELLRVRNMLMRMATEIVTHKAAGELGIEGDIQVEERAVTKRSPMEIRLDYHRTLKELLVVFQRDGVIPTSYNHFLDELINLESEIASLNSNITLKEQEFEGIREEFGEQEASLRYAHLDLSQEYRNFDAVHPKKGRREESYLADLQFQITALQKRIEQISKAKHGRIVELNREISAYKKSVEERELEIAHHYAKIQTIVERARSEPKGKISLKYGVLFEKLDHLRKALISMRRSAGATRE